MCPQDSPKPLLDLCNMLSSAIEDCQSWEGLNVILDLLNKPEIFEQIQPHSPKSKTVNATLSGKLLRLSILDEQTELHIDNAILIKAAQLYHDCNWLAPYDPRWDQVINTLKETRGDDALDEDIRLINLIFVTSILNGRETALHDLFRWVQAGTLLRHKKLDLIGFILWENGFYQELTNEEQISKLVDVTAIMKNSDDVFIYLQSLQFLHLLCFDKKMPTKWLDLVFESVALPLLLSSIEHEKFNAALYLEMFYCTNWLKKIETPEHYDAAFKRWVPQLISAGRLFAEQNQLPQLQRPDQKGKCLVVGFFVHQPSTLAHIDFMLTAIEGMNNLEPERLIEPRIYVFDGFSEDMSRRCSDIGVEVVWLSQHVPDSEIYNLPKRLLALRDQLTRDNVTALIWLSLPEMMGFAFEMRLAPVQIWLSVKFWPSVFNNADGYLAGAKDLSRNPRPRILSGREWRTLPVVFNNLYDPSKESDAAILRDEYRQQHSLLVGTISREEKADNERYLNVVSKILKANPDVGFIYSGREPRQNIHEFFEREGVGKQCAFVGWVDTKLYAQVLDIFLSTWPMGSGLTICEALAAGTPVVYFQGDESLLDWLGSNLQEIKKEEGGSFERYVGLFNGAKTDKDYIDHVQKLIDDPELRRDKGDTGKHFSNTYLEDISRLGRATADHILSIVDAKKSEETASNQPNEHF